MITATWLRDLWSRVASGRPVAHQDPNAVLRDAVTENGKLKEQIRRLQERQTALEMEREASRKSIEEMARRMAEACSLLCPERERLVPRWDKTAPTVRDYISTSDLPPSKRPVLDPAWGDR